MAVYLPPRSTCRVCGGAIHDRGIFHFENIWLHTFDADWVGNPHNAEPDPADVPAS